MFWSGFLCTPCFVDASSGGFGEPVHAHRLAIACAARLCDKDRNRMCCLLYSCGTILLGVLLMVFDQYLRCAPLSISDHPASPSCEYHVQLVQSVQSERKKEEK